MMGEADGEVLTPATPARSGPADASAIDEAANIINQAKLPVLLLGLLASAKDAAEAVRGLIVKAKLPVVCTYQGAGIVPRERFDRFAGRVGLFHTQPGDNLLDAADVVVTVGFDPIEYEPALWNKGKKRRVIHIDAVPADIDRDYRPNVELTGNIASTVHALADRVGVLTLPAFAPFLREVEQDRSTSAKQAAAMNGVPVHPMRLVHEIQKLLSDDTTLCLDMGSFHIWLARHLYSFRARQILMTNGQQTLGVGLPWAIAASLVRPSEKVISISGDGGLLFSAMELETAVRLRCNLVHMVWIDGHYDMVGLQEVAKYGRTSGVDFGPVDVVTLAEAFGAKGLRIEAPDQISATLKKALAMHGPVLVGVPVDYRDNHKLMEIVQPDAFN
jgi:acetolactate synthase-1/2/3 large subunit